LRLGSRQGIGAAGRGTVDVVIGGCERYAGHAEHKTQRGQRRRSQKLGLKHLNVAVFLDLDKLNIRYLVPHFRGSRVALETGFQFPLITEQNYAANAFIMLRMPSTTTNTRSHPAPLAVPSRSRPMPTGS